VPVFTAFTIDRSFLEHALLTGGGAGGSRERALAQALFEVGQARIVLKFHRPTSMKHIRADSTPSEMTEFFDSAIYYGYVENLERISWYTEGREVVQWEDVPTASYANVADEYHAALAWLRQAGINPIVLNLSGACWPGACVVRVFVPQLTQAGVPSHPYLGHRRFYDIPRQLGITDRRLRFSDLTADPLPLS
jgi:ribosomal protein S12 methylthiotransferase accessory factor